MKFKVVIRNEVIMAKDAIGVNNAKQRSALRNVVG
jgi:hypothetical protein